MSNTILLYTFGKKCIQTNINVVCTFRLHRLTFIFIAYIKCSARLYFIAILIKNPKWKYVFEGRSRPTAISYLESKSRESSNEKVTCEIDCKIKLQYAFCLSKVHFLEGKYSSHPKICKKISHVSCKQKGSVCICCLKELRNGFSLKISRISLNYQNKLLWFWLIGLLIVLSQLNYVDKILKIFHPLRLRQGSSNDELHR